MVVGLAAFAFAAQSEESPIVTSDAAGEEPGSTDAEDVSTSPGQGKHAAAVVAETGATAEEVAELRAAGAGWGLIRHGYALAEAENISVDEAIERIRDGELVGKPPWAGPKNGAGMPPGQAKKAAEIAAVAGVSVEVVEGARSSGAGWGQLKKAAELVAGEGLSFDAALESVRSATADADGS